MKPRPSSPKRVEALLLRLRFQRRPGKGAHRFYWRWDGRRTVVSFHPGDVPTGTLRRIIQDAGMTVEEFNRMI